MTTTVKSKKHAKSAWRVKTQTVNKRWGREVRWPAMPSIQGKILYIEAGQQTSFKYYQLKNENLMVLSGKVEISYGNELSLSDPVQHPFKKDIFVAGEGINIQSCCPYMITAIEDSEVLEIGDHQETQKVKVTDLSI
tara:strand:- start:25 stop:435 length:411 start_codon:yes stop_codon:yes gene_type:complete